MDAEYDFSKKISAVCGFLLQRSCGKNEIHTNGKQFFANFVAERGLFRLRDIAYFVAFIG